MYSNSEGVSKKIVIKTQLFPEQDTNLCRCETDRSDSQYGCSDFWEPWGKAYIELRMRHLFGAHELVKLLRGQIA